MEAVQAHSADLKAALKRAGFWSLILLQFGLCVLVHVQSLGIFVYFIVLGVLPVLGIRSISRSDRSLERKQFLSIILLMAAVFLDLFYSFQASTPLHSRPIPRGYEVSTHRSEKFIAPTSTKASPGGHPQIGYPSILLRTPYFYSADFLAAPEKTFTEIGQEDRQANLFLPRSYFDVIQAGIAPNVVEYLVNGENSRFRWVSQSLEMPLEKQLQWVKNRSSGIMRATLKHTVLLAVENGAQDRIVQKKNPDYQMKLSEFHHNQIQVKLNSPEAGFFYWANGYDNHWVASVDGTPTKVYRANLSGMAIKVPEGAHTIEFKYEPVLYLSSMKIYYVVLIALLLSVLCVGLKSRLLNHR